MKITKTQIEYMNAITQFMQDNGYCPTVREIGKILGKTSPATVYNMLLTLEDKGFITIEKGKNRAIKINNMPTYKELLQRIDKVREFLLRDDIAVLKYYDEPSETGSYELATIDVCLMLDGDSNENN